MLRSGGLLDRILESDPSLRVVLLSPMSKDPQFVREFERPRVTFVDQRAHLPSGLEARLLAIVQASYLSQGRTSRSGFAWPRRAPTASFAGCRSKV